MARPMRKRRIGLAQRGGGCQFRPMRVLRFSPLVMLAILLVGLYFLRLESDSIAAMFGILWSDEGAYLLPARNQVLYGAAHLFAGDRYIPETTAPLLHRFALALMSKADTVYWLRFGMAVWVLTGIGLIARLAARYHGDAKAGLSAALVLLLTPMLFFYARIGLSEGLQFTLMALSLNILYALHKEQKPQRAALLAMALAASIGFLFISKVTCVAGAAGLTLAGLVCMANKPHPWRLVILSGLAGVLMLVLVFICWFGDDFSTWFGNNFGTYVYGEMVAGGGGQGVWQFLRKHFIGINHFTTLMPIFVLGFPALVIAANKRDFLSLLWLATFTMLLLESFLAPELRRNFFGMSMLIILASLTIGQFLREGVPAIKTPGIPSRLSWGLILLYALGVLSFIGRSMIALDGFFIMLGATFGLLMALVLFVRGPDGVRARKMLLVVLGITSLAPMLYQSIFSPYTVRNAIAHMEALIPPDAAASGMMLPWYFQGMKREMVFTNCRPGNWAMANDIEEVPEHFTRFYVTHPDMLENYPECLPPHFERYKKVLEFKIFHPINKGIDYGSSQKWKTVQPFVMYERKN